MIKKSKGLIILAIAGLAYLIFKKKSMNKKINNVLFIGDSITAIWDYVHSTNIKWTYPTYLKELLTQKGKSINIDVLARGGQQTSWMVNYFNLYNKPVDRVYFYGGINDAFSNRHPIDILKNVNKIIDQAKKLGAEVYIITGYKPLPDFMDYNKMPTTIYVTRRADYIPLIQNYIDYQKSLKDLYNQRRDFTLIPEFDLKNYTSDGIHPNVAGAKIIANEILKTL